MTYKVFFDGYDLSEYCVIQNVKKPLMSGINNIYQSSNSSYRLRNDYRSQISLEIEVTIIHDVVRNLDMLNRILYTRDHRQLWISTQPDRYLLCKLDGDIRPSNIDLLSKFTLKFVSPNTYWNSIDSEKVFDFDSNGRVLATNDGTAPTPPVIDITFPSDNGYLALISPSGYIALGNALEDDDVPVPPSEFALNEELENTNGWTRLTDASAWIPDYNKLTSAGTAKHDQWGMQLDTSTLGTSDQWHGHAYVKNFIAGAAEIEADNFNLRSRVDIADLSGSRNQTMAMLIVVMDEQNRPIMSTSIYDVSGDKNELTVTFKIPDTAVGREKHSKIIHTAKIPRLNGFVQMNKSGQRFEWTVHNNATTGTTSSTRNLKIGDIVHLNKNARTIYDWNGRALSLDQSIIGQQLKVFEVRNSPKGRYGLRNVRYGYVEGFFEPDAIKETSVQGTTSTQATQVKHSITDQSLAQLRPYKVFVWQAKWGATQPYSVFSLNSVVVNRLYTTDKLELTNTFMTGDNLTIDNREGAILHNGVPFTGFNDYDSRFFDIDGGTSEIRLEVSDWAQMPDAKLRLESRWL